MAYDAMASDVRTKAVLAIEAAMPEASRQQILARFRNTNLNGAAVADILDILNDHDYGLDKLEPFYDDGLADDAHRLLDWEPYSDDEPDTFEVALRHSLIAYSSLAMVLLTDQEPTVDAVASLAGAAREQVNVN